jgi:hypothetical protein
LTGLIRAEEKRRSAELANIDSDAAYDQWIFQDRPFINEMCLMLLVAIRHQVERELLFIAARVNRSGTITRKEHRQYVMEQRNLLRGKAGFNKLTAALRLSSFPQWAGSMKTLELLANSLKHNPWQEPDEQLLLHLDLPTEKELVPPVVAYMPLPESTCFQEGLARSLNLPKDADYCTIVGTLADLANEFLDAVVKVTPMCGLSGRVSLTEFGC